jgi:hypothetical protein
MIQEFGERVGIGKEAEAILADLVKWLITKHPKSFPALGAPPRGRSHKPHPPADACAAILSLARAVRRPSS